MTKTAYLHCLDTQLQPLTVTIGGLTLHADDYTLEVKRAAVTHTLSDGSYHETLLQPIPCTLTLCGRFLSTDAPMLQQTLRTALNEHTCFDFTLDTLAFTDTAITAYRITRPVNERFCRFSVTFSGTHSGEVTAP